MLVSLLRTVLMYGVILLAVRLLGKRQISQLQASELVATLLLSELAVLPIQEEGLPLWRGLLPMCALVLCELGASWGMLSSGAFASWCAAALWLSSSGARCCRARCAACA